MEFGLLNLLLPIFLLYHLAKLSALCPSSCLCAWTSYDLVLGRDWSCICRQTLPYASFTLSFGIVWPRKPSSIFSKSCHIKTFLLI
ncbi:hypothetical protein B0H11DRAFT_786699 [Mycena galericulata]|nr:hypothetical protein B0H11DRAFT_786699 [Mycena galericulata]